MSSWDNNVLMLAQTGHAFFCVWEGREGGERHMLSVSLGSFMLLLVVSV